MDLTAFAAGPALTTRTFSDTRSCVLPSRDTRISARSRPVLLRRPPVLPSKVCNALLFKCLCAARCLCKNDSAATATMKIALSVGEKAIADLMAENAAFVRGEAKVFPGVPEERIRLSTEGQTPKVAIIACADSRVAPEILFRANVGELFVIRTAGNTAWGDEALGSLEFAINVLKVSAVMVVGHTKCGAITAAVAGGDPLPGALGRHIINISQALAAKGGLVSDVDAAVEVNVKVALDFLRKDPDGAVPQGEKVGLALRGAVYDIDTGAVRLIA